LLFADDLHLGLPKSWRSTIFVPSGIWCSLMVLALVFQYPKNDSCSSS
jgi:hypothetical protein